MPYSFTEIERRKSYVIHAVFISLFLLYLLFGVILFAGVRLIFWGVKAITLERLMIPFSWAVILPGFKELVALAGFAFLLSLGHFLYVSRNLLTRIIGALRAEILRPSDHYHKTYQNIIEELSAATGGKSFMPMVIPSMALNACAASDFNGDSIICLTEGILAKLNRSQIEAVVAHEAAHVLEGDSLETTLTVSLFNLMSALLKNYPKRFFKFSWYSARAGLASLYVLAVSVLVYLLLSITHAAGLVLNMFMSRQREFRADAIAVRLTRNPRALAEALYIISNNWRGAGLPGDTLGSLFIVNHHFSRLEEDESLFADLFSTHPPINSRLSILLDMAHADQAALASALAKSAHKPRQIVQDICPVKESKWLFHKEGEWIGPFAAADLAGIDWITPDMMVKKMGAKSVCPAVEDKELLDTLQELKKEAAHRKDHFSCPRCHVPLVRREYESTEVYQCPTCRGYLVEEPDITRIIAREDAGFSDEIIRQARKIEETNKKIDHVMDGGLEGHLYAAEGLTCPRCRHKKARMFRRFYSAMYHVVIDKCVFCGLIWFDKDELDILQFLIEEKRGSFNAPS